MAISASKRLSIIPPEPPPKKGEHIFNATWLTDLAIRWKKAVEDGRTEESLELLDQLVKGSTPMFERLAQHEKFDTSVDLPTLIMSAQEKMVRWLLAWKPKEGKLFSWLSSCAKNAFRSEVVKTNTHRNRFHATSDNLEKFFGDVDHHETLKYKAAIPVRERLKEITCRWGLKQEIGAVRFCLDALTGEGHDRKITIHSVAYAFGISPDLAKFFYNWALFALRNEMYEAVRVPFTEQELFRHRYSYTHLVDLLDIISWDQLKRIIMTLGGQRLKIPTPVQMARLREDYLMSLEVEKTDLDEHSVETIGKKYGKTQKSAQEIYEEMLRTSNVWNDGEFNVYDSE